MNFEDKLAAVCDDDIVLNNWLQPCLVEMAKTDELDAFGHDIARWGIAFEIDGGPLGSVRRQAVEVDFQGGTLSFLVVLL